MRSETTRAQGLASPRFLSFLLAQFLGAANDNAYKITLTLLILSRITDEPTQIRLTSLATALFPLPFLMFSPLAGYLADRYSKQRLLVVTKLPEVLAMGLAIPALLTGNLTLLMLALFLMATQSTFFSPTKYGLLPESLDNSKLSMANGILQMTTYVAILCGSIAGVMLFARFKDTPALIGWVFLGVAVLGVAAAAYVPRTPPGNPAARFAWNVFSASAEDWREARKVPALFHTLFGIAFFGFLGALFLTVIPVFARNALKMSESGSGVLLMILSVGVAAGSLVAGKLSRGRVEVGLVPIGSVGLSLFALDLALFGHPAPGGWPVRACVDVFLLGVSAGLYVVPLNALLQQRSPQGQKGRLIAFSNVLTFAAVLFAAAVPWVFIDLLGLSTVQLVLGIALLTLLATVYIVKLLPDSFVRLVLLVVTGLFYRVRVEGETNVPREGALLVVNHQSWVDALLIGSSLDQMVRFVIYRPFYELPGMRWFFRMMHTIPVAPGDSPELRDASLAQARQEIESGHVVCIFAEGAITRTGNLLKFKRGFERIADGMTAPVVPVLLDGIWGSVFSWDRGRLLFKFPRRHSSLVRVIFGEPLPPSTGATEVRQAVQELSVRAFELRKQQQWTLPAEFGATARRFWWRRFITDSDGRRLRFGQALVRSLALRNAWFEAEAGTGSNIGLLLPPSADAAIANLAVLAAGHCAVNLDPDADAEQLARVVRAAELRTIIACARARDRVRALGVRCVSVEDRVGSRLSRLPIWLGCRLLPGPLFRRFMLRGDLRAVDATAAVVFSSSPRLARTSRGVRLSHHNILSNLESLKQVFRVSRDDRVLGVIPWSSAFGLVGTMLLPAVAGVEVSFHHDGTDAAGVARIVRDRAITLLPVAPSLLEIYLDGIDAADFASLREVVVAGERLSPELGQRFTEKYGIEPLEGFGCAECAPLVSLNVPQLVRGKHAQVSRRSGTSGHPLPGVAVKIVDPESGDVLRPDRVGRLLVKGPNVMQGYLDHPDLTRRVLDEHGWYRTEFLASQDEDGFLTIGDMAEPWLEGRPRDPLGRPLPAGSVDALAGFEVPDVDASTTAAAFERARRYFDVRRFYEAHEVLEAIWNADGVAAGDRDFWKGLTQVAVGCCHAQRGNPRGAVALLRRAMAYLAAYEGGHRGVDVAKLRSAAAALAAALEAGPRGVGPAFFQFPLAGDRLAPSVDRSET